MRLALLALIALAGCATQPPAPLPSPPVVVEVPVTRYVPVPSELTRRCQWIKDASPSQVFKAAESRRRCLEVYEPNLRSIEGIQGSPVED